MIMASNSSLVSNINILFGFSKPLEEQTFTDAVVNLAVIGSQSILVTAIIESEWLP